MQTQTPTKRRRFYLRHLERKGIIRLDHVEDRHGTVRLHPTPRGDAHVTEIDRDARMGLSIMATEMMAQIRGSQTGRMRADGSVVETGDAFHSDTGDDIDAAAVEAGVEIAAKAAAESWEAVADA